MLKFRFNMCYCQVVCQMVKMHISNIILIFLSEGSVSWCVFVNVTAIENGLCGYQWDSSYGVVVIIAVVFVCVCCHTWMGSIPILCDCDVQFILKIWITVKPCEQFHRIALKNCSHIHIRSRHVNEPLIQIASRIDHLPLFESHHLC